VSVSSLRSRFGLSVRQRTHALAPSTHIFLQGIVRHANGMLSVTQECTSLEEMETEIEQLKAELDEMLQQARRAFRAGSNLGGRAAGM
jgi:HAMP domain-containing protein